MRTGVCVAVGLGLWLCAGVARAAEGAAPAVRTEEVSFESGGVTLGGTLWRPSGGPAAGVVLLGDDAGVGEPLARYAERLTGQGLVVLIPHPGTPVPGLRERAEQALAAMRVLRARVGPLREGPVGLMGLGKGAWAAVRAAAGSPEPGFVVVVSGGAGPVWKQEAHRLRNEGRQLGLTGPELVDLSESLATLYDARLYEPAHEARARRTLDFHRKRAQRRRWYALSPLRRFEGLEPPALLEAQRQQWRDVLSYDSTEDLGRVRCPVLALVGEQDVVAPAKPTVQALSRAVERGTPEAGVVTVQVLPGEALLVPGPRRMKPAVDAVRTALEAWLGELARQ